MNLLMVKNDTEMAECAAKLTAEAIKATLEANNESSLVLAGGNTPLSTYEVLSSKYYDYLDWQRVWFLVGDERHVPTDDPESNWGNAEKKLLNLLNAGHKLVPNYDINLETMAESFKKSLDSLPKNSNGRPRLDMVILGVGEDGHTLSLFPKANLDTDSFVEIVDNSPKLPKERVTLTLAALKQAKRCVVLASGKAKAAVVGGIVAKDDSLPIAKVVKAIEEKGGEVCLLVDQAAASLIAGH